MWLNLDKAQIATIRNGLGLLHKEFDTAEAVTLIAELDQKVKDSFEPGIQAWVEKAFDLHQDEGTLEVDQQGDGSAMVSYSDDGGAYVMAWVWVSNADMGIEEPEEYDADSDPDSQIWNLELFEIAGDELKASEVLDCNETLAMKRLGDFWNEHSFAVLNSDRYRAVLSTVEGAEVSSIGGDDSD